MNDMKVLDLLQCFFWATGALMPMALSIIAASVELDRDNKKIEGSGFFVGFIACGFQAFILLCAYKAGIKQ